MYTTLSLPTIVLYMCSEAMNNTQQIDTWKVWQQNFMHKKKKKEKSMLKRYLCVDTSYTYLYITNIN